MKNLSIMVVAILSFLLVGCSSSDKKASLNSADVNQKVVENKIIQHKSESDEKKEGKEDITTATIDKNKNVKNNNRSIKTNIKKDKEISKLHQVKNEPKEKKNNNEVFYGKWIIDSIVTYGHVSCYSEKDIKEILGKEIFYSKDLCKYKNNILRRPNYKKETYNEDKFHLMYRIPIKKLGINVPQIILISIYKDEKFLHIWDDIEFNDLIIIDNNTIILPGAGAFFKAVRKK